MRHTFIILLLVLFWSCQDKAKFKTSDWNEFDKEITRLKSLRKDSINNTLICNFKFGMTKNEVKNLEDSLKEKGLFESFDDLNIFFNENYQLQNSSNSNKFIKGNITVSYENNKLNNLNIGIEKSDFKNALKVFTSCYSKPDLFLDDGKYGTKYAWIKGNQEIILNYKYGFPEINYYDYISVSLEEIKKRQEEFARREYVGNDDYDGSVKQVVTYLKEKLKDPKSYESISWSKVMHKDGYYLVRHKYRAKNSLGGYVIENKLFYIDLCGAIYKIEEFNE
ncbi:MAG: hypothetical protein AB7S72_13645 [Draconibacterium sp.]